MGDGKRSRWFHQSDPLCGVLFECQSLNLKFHLRLYESGTESEIFSEPDFFSSIEAIKQSLKRIEAHPKLTFVLGGARSGKSTYAQDLAQERGGKVLYVATATAGDEEMKVRIENHRAERPSEWRTLEAPLNVGEAIERELAEHPADVILLDCMTLLATNVILQLPEDTSEKEASDALGK